MLRTDGLVVGAMPGTKYINSTCQVPWNNRLFLFSDGVIEITKADHQIQTFDEFIKLLDHYQNFS